MLLPVHLKLTVVFSKLLQLHTTSYFQQLVAYHKLVLVCCSIPGRKGKEKENQPFGGDQCSWKVPTAFIPSKNKRTGLRRAETHVPCCAFEMVPSERTNLCHVGADCLSMPNPTVPRNVLTAVEHPRRHGRSSPQLSVGSTLQPAVPWALPHSGASFRGTRIARQPAQARAGGQRRPLPAAPLPREPPPPAALGPSPGQPGGGGFVQVPLGEPVNRSPRRK